MNDTRQKILNAALRLFAARGYAGTSVQEIVAAARVTKPALYYYFQNKADLYKALVDSAYEERYRQMQEAAARAQDLPDQLVEICLALFSLVRRRRDLTRLAFATAFAAPGEVPVEAGCARQGVRQFELLHDLMKQAQARGELNPRFNTEDLTMGFAGVVHIHVMAYLVHMRSIPDRAAVRRMIELFFAGAQPRVSATPNATLP